MKNPKLAKVVPISSPSQKTDRVDLEEFGRFTQLLKREGLQIDRVMSSVIDAYINHLEQARDGLGLRLIPPASIRLQEAVLAGFYLWLKGTRIRSIQ